MGDIHFSMVHEVQDCCKISECDTLQVEKRMGMGVIPQDTSKERRASRKDDFVGLNLAVTYRQGDIKEVFFFPDFSEGDADVALKVVPAKTELLA